MKKVVKICCFAALLLLLTFGIYRVLSFKDTMGLVGSSVRQLSYTEDNKIDVAFVGSSHVYSGVSPATLWNEFGIASFDMSVSGMDMFSEYYYIKHLLKTQSPRYVFVDVYSFTFLTHGVVENIYRNMLGIPFSKESIDLSNAYFKDNKGEEDKLSYILKWPIIHTRYKEVTYNDFKDVEFARYGRGERIIFEQEGVISAPAFEKYGCAELDDTRLKVLNDMKKLSEDNDFELIFCVIPYTVSETDAMYVNAVAKYAAENGLEFVNFGSYVDEMGIDFSKDSSDSLHLNTDGAEKLSRWIGNYLVSEKEINTHWGEDGYAFWDLDYAYLAHRRSVNFLAKIYMLGDSEGFFRTLNAIPGISYVVSASDDDIMELYSDTLELLDIGTYVSANEGVWIKVRGKDIRYVPLTAGVAEYAEFDELTSVKMLMTGEEIEVLIGSNNGNTRNKGISVAVYDNVDHRFVGLYLWDH